MEDIETVQFKLRRPQEPFFRLWTPSSSHGLTWNSLNNGVCKLFLGGRQAAESTSIRFTYIDAEGETSF
jgi:hypothetical protein